MANFLCPEFLRKWTGARPQQEGINLFLTEEPHRIGFGTRHPVNVLTGVQTQIGQNDGDERVRGGSYPINRYPLPFQIPYRADPIRPKQLETADVDSCKYHKRFPCIEIQNSWPRESHSDVNLTGDQHLSGSGIWLAAPDVLDISEPLAT